ncbi:MAG TPA: NADPH-dependent FMN reductase, partial [Ruminococcaceae bacterium]|nr:NADPH-dependent FMN reductase [Oscillospiraceae bacterium]
RDQTHPLSGKPLAIMSVSPSLLGGARVQYHLRQVCVVLNLEVLNQPEVFIGLAAGKFSADGKLTDEETRSRIAELIQALVDQARKLKK